MARSRRYEDEPDDDRDDDRDDRRRRREPPPPSSGSAVKIIAIIGGVFVVIALICGGLVWYVVSSAKKGIAQVNEDLQKRADAFQKDAEARRIADEGLDKGQSTKAANAFLQELKGRRFDAAYESTTKNYQNRVTKEKFRALVTEYGTEIDRVMTFRADLFAQPTGNTFTFKETLLRDGFQQLTLTLVKDNGIWKIDELIIAMK